MSYSASLVNNGNTWFHTKVDIVMFSDSFPDEGFDYISIIFVTYGTPLFYVLGNKG